MDNIIKMDANTEIMVNALPKRFVFISDLHFDCYYKAPSREERNERIERLKRGLKVDSKDPELVEDHAFLEREDLFIQFVSENYANDILILAGDYYTNYHQTLSFVKKLEALKITSYFVLGNHDFASNDQTAFSDIIGLFDSETSSHKYCKFLMTGKKYYHDDVCIIGDTGWAIDSVYRVSTRGSFTNGNFPKALYAREEKAWIKFAKSVLKSERKVLIVTHFPQSKIKHSREHWINWLSAKLFLDTDNCWKIFGHTHQRGHFQHYNNICSQLGYTSRHNAEISEHTRYRKDDFGILEKVTVNASNRSFSLASAFNKIAPFYSTKLIQVPEKELEAIKDISRRGYLRVGNADNKRALAQLLYNKEEYLLRVRETLKAVEFAEYIGYALNERVSFRSVDAVKNSIDILENVSPSNVRPFMTAFIITAYAYNGMISYLEKMRPVDDYDIMRFWMLFVTVQKFGIAPDEIKSVKRNAKECLDFQNAQLYLPKVNDKSLRLEEVHALLSNTTLLTGTQQPNNMKFSPKVKPEIACVPESCFHVGDLVMHKAFGTGKILSLRATDAGTILEIEFEQVGIKSIMASFVKLATNASQ